MVPGEHQDKVEAGEDPESHTFHSYQQERTSSPLHSDTILEEKRNGKELFGREKQSPD